MKYVLRWIIATCLVLAVSYAVGVSVAVWADWPLTLRISTSPEKEILVALVVTIICFGLLHQHDGIDYDAEF